MFFPDYKSVEDPNIRAKYESVWGTTLDPKRGLTVVEIMDAVHRDEIKGMYIMGENPAMSDPDVEHARAALAQLEHLVVQDLFLTETAKYADVVLPASAWPEKDGTVTNTNRQVQMGRTALPPRQEWEAWLAAHGNADVVSRKLLAVQDLERQDVEVLTAAADVADRPALRAAVAQARARVGTVHGVFHAAAAFEEGVFKPVQDLLPESCAGLFRSKVDGLASLAEVFRDQPLDFLMVFSTLSTVLGGLGFAAYAAANAAMAALAGELDRTTRTPCLVVDWDGWRFGDAGPGGGMGSSLTELALSPQEGIATLERILALGAGPRIAVSTSDLQARIDRWVGLKELRRSTGRDGGKAERRERRGVMTLYTAPCGELEVALVELWQDLLGVEPVGIYDNFFQLGGHSLLGMQLNARLRQTFAIDLPLRVLFESPTVADLAAVVESALAGEIDGLSEAEAESQLDAAALLPDGGSPSLVNEP